MSKQYFNSKAATWDRSAAEKDASKLKAMAERLDILPGSAVLDVGTGTGVFVPYLLQKIGSAGSLTCLDYAEEMLKAAASKGFKGNIRYLCADIEDSALPDNSYDAVVCYSVFPHFRDHLRALKEIYRVLKKKGVLYICHTSGRGAINKIHANIPELQGHLFPENEHMQRLFEEAGFTDISIFDRTDDYLVIARKNR